MSMRSAFWCGNSNGPGVYRVKCDLPLTFLYSLLPTALRTFRISISTVTTPWPLYKHVLLSCTLQMQEETALLGIRGFFLFFPFNINETILFVLFCNLLFFT